MRVFRPTRPLFTRLALLAALTGLAVSPALADDEVAGKEISERIVALADLPEAVRIVIVKEAVGHELAELKLVETTRGLFCEAEWIDGEDEVSILLKLDGTVIDREREKADGEEDDGPDKADEKDRDEG